MIGAGHVACMGEMWNTYKILVGNPEERDKLEDKGVDGRIILKMMLKEILMWGCGVDSTGSWYGPVEVFSSKLL